MVYRLGSGLRRWLSTAAKPSVEITTSCRDRLRELSAQRGKSVTLRVTVDGGGCSGFQYAFQLQDWDALPEIKNLESDGDILIKQDDVAVIVDTLSLAYIAGSKVDYVQEMISSSFRITDNPNSESSCGCGVSFSPKM